MTGPTNSFDLLNIERYQEGGYAGIDTHQWKAFDRILRAIGYIDSWVVVDPFARNCPLAKHWSNDLNPTTSAKFHLDAQEFLEGVPSNVADLLIFDPPFSADQAERKYGEGVNLYTEAGRIPNMMLEIGRILKPGGILLKFGYNSTQHFTGLMCLDLFLINFGGNRNDVIVSSWKNTQTSLEDF